MTNKKVYYIEIEMQDARTQLADAVQKLEELDKRLKEVGETSEEGKKIVAEMAAAAKSVKNLTAEVEGLSDELDALAPGSPAALKKQVEELERAFDRTTEGTKEFDEALLALSRAQGELAGLQTKIDALDPEKQAAAFVDFTNGIVGGFALASTAAQQWGGLSAESAQEVDQRLQSLLVVMSAFEAISKATSGEVLANVKNMYALGKGFLFGAESASVSSKIIRGALVATGVGALVVLVGLLVANWDSFKAKFGGSEKLFTKIKEVASGVFSGLIASLKSVGQIVEKLWEGDFSGAVAKAKHVGKDIAAGYAAGVQEVVDDSNRQLLQKQIEAQERLLKVQQAGGYDTAKLQRQLLADKLKVLKQGTDEEKKAYAEAATDLQAFDAEQAKKRRADALASTLARIGAVVALEQAKGQESYNEQLKYKKRELAGLLAAETQNDAAIRTKRGEIDAFIAQHDAEVAEKKRAALVLAQQNELALEEKQGKDTLALRIAFAEQLLSVDADGTEKARTQRDADLQALLLLQEEYNQREKTQREAFRAQAQEYDQNGADVDRDFAKAAGEAASDAYVEGLGKAAKQANQGADLGRTILTSVFGIRPQDVEEVKGKLNEAFTEIAQGVNSVVNTLFTNGLAEAQAEIDAAQARLQELDSQLSTLSSQRQSDESALASASGSKRDYLLKKIQAERKAESDLAAQKAVAAKQEAAAQKEKAKLDKEQQAISAASTAIEAVLLGIKAAQTLVDIADKGKFGFDNIALAVAAAVSLGAGIFAMKNAAQSFESGTGALGSDGVLRGPSHGQGGIGLFNSYGHFYGEAEGGEAISPADASANNATVLELIRTKGRTRRLTPLDYMSALAGEAQGIARSVVPTPKAYFDAGGIMNKSGTPGGQASSQDVSMLAAQLSQLNGQVAQLVASNGSIAESSVATQAHTQQTAAATSTTASYGPARLAIGHQEIQQMREEEAAAQQAQNWATLGPPQPLR